MIIYNKYQINEATRSELMDQVEKAQAQYQDLQDEVEEMTDKADKEYRKYRDEINFGQRNQFKAHEEIEGLEYKLADNKEHVSVLIKELTAKQNVIDSSVANFDDASKMIIELREQLAGCEERSDYWLDRWIEQRKELKKANR